MPTFKVIHPDGAKNFNFTADTTNKLGLQFDTFAITRTPPYFHPIGSGVPVERWFDRSASGIEKALAFLKSKADEPWFSMVCVHTTWSVPSVADAILAMMERDKAFSNRRWISTQFSCTNNSPAAVGCIAAFVKRALPFVWRVEIEIEPDAEESFEAIRAAFGENTKYVWRPLFNAKKEVVDEEAVVDDEGMVMVEEEVTTANANE